jgi:HEAT repeat protein
MAEPTAASLEGLIDGLRRGDWLERRRARLALTEVGRAAALPLARLLAEGDEQARWEAARTLLDLRDPQAVPALIEALEDRNADIRWLAAEALFRIGEPALIPLLRRLLVRGDSPWLQERAHHVLHHLAARGVQPEVIRPVLAALEGPWPAMAAPVAAATALKALEGGG